MTTTPPTTIRPADIPGDDVRIARVHLRMGQLTLARAELEDLLRRDALDVDGLAALAEARWRTGDAGPAADAAMAHLENGGLDDVSLCIAAEAVAADGRLEEARVLMDRLPVSDAATLDTLFAGMPRRAFWAAGPVDRSDLEELRRETDTKVFGRSMLSREAAAEDRRAGSAAGRAGAEDRAGAGRGAGRGASRAGGAGGGDGDLAGDEEPDATEGPSRAVPGPRDVIEATGSVAWAAASKVAGVAGAAGHAAAEAAASVAGAAAGAAFGRGGRGRESGRATGSRIKGQLDPAAELARAREELGHKPDRAFMRLALVLRHDPTLAPAVLDALHLRREPMAALLRGDAQRLLGRHLEAEAAFDSAAESLDR